MKHPVACIFLSLSLIPAFTLGEIKSQNTRRSKPQSGKTRVKQDATRNNGAQKGPLRICQGVPLPAGYVIVAYETSSSCPHGAYVLKRDGSSSRFDAPANVNAQQQVYSTASVSRPRRTRQAQADPVAVESRQTEATTLTPPTLSGTPLGIKASATEPPAAGVEEVEAGDVVRIETNLVAVPVSVLDRQGRFVPNLRRENFRVFENGQEQKIAFFEPTEKPFTVALLLDTSGSTVFHMSEIREAAIAFAKQLRPQDSVLVVTFNQEVLLLTEATNDLDVVTEVIARYANTGFSTRLYDALNLVINERLNRIKGRKAIVLFTDGVDTASYLASYESTLREAEELDTLIYPIQYDTTDFAAATQNTGSISIVTTRSSRWPFPSRSSSRVIYGSSLPGSSPRGSTIDDYKLADQYLNHLAYKTGARLYKANDYQQLSEAFSKIAAELRYQYSLGYYPQTTLQEGERRLIKVKVDQPDLAVRARDSYVQRSKK